MKTNTRPMRASASKVQLFALGVLCMVSAFAVGTQTSGSVQTVAHTEALGGRLPGDVNADDTLSAADAIVILEVVNGYRDASPRELLGDPNADGQLTIDDALRILRDINATPIN